MTHEKEYSKTIVRKRDRLKARSLAKGVGFSLTKAQVEGLSVEATCPCCKMQMTLIANHDNEVSIDRIVPMYGYIWINTVAICRSCNNRKADMSPDQLDKAGLAWIADWVRDECKSRNLRYSPGAIYLFRRWIGKHLISLGRKLSR